LLVGGAGDDFLSGSEGIDTYLFLAGDPGVDIVMDTGQPHWEINGIDMPTPFFDWWEDISGIPQPPLVGLNDYQGWEFMFESGLIAKDTVEFGEGIRLSDLQLSWGEYLPPQNLAFGTYRYEYESTARFDASTLALTTLDISWGPDQVVRVVIPPSLMFLADTPSDFLRGTNGWPYFMGGYGWGIEQFKFSDGSIMSMLDMLRLAPAAPTFDPFNVDGVQTGTNLPEEIYGAGGNDVLSGRGGNDFLIGGDGNDVLQGGENADYLRGGAGHDYLDGGKGHNTLIGGKGNDTLILGKNSENTIIFNQGDGFDILQTATRDEGHDNEIHFGAGVTQDNLWFSRAANDLRISVLGTSDGMTIEGWYSNKHKPIEEIKTSNGYELEDKKIELLVQAMAVFSPIPGNGNVLPTEMPEQLQPVLVAVWESGHG
jgi:hypothetical protein